MANLEITADDLARIEAKLDAILERLKWAPESLADWYASQHQQTASEPDLFKK
jgi:hypothetical protein